MRKKIRKILDDYINDVEERNQKFLDLNFGENIKNKIVDVDMNTLQKIAEDLNKLRETYKIKWVDIKNANRFYVDGIKIGGYWKIGDKENMDEPIWIDCPESYLNCIIDALNERLK